MESFYTRFKKIFDESGMSQTELSKLTGIRASSISDYYNGKYTPKQDKVTLLAEALNVSPSWLYCTIEDITEERPLPSNLIPINKVNRIPIVGTIAAGKPITATENIESYIMLDQEYKADFALKIKGDSMIDAGINDGDLALIIKDRPIDNGDIYAVMIDGEATLKKIYKNEEYLTLQACNSKYPAKIVKEDDNPYIVGKLSGIVRKY
ncbi:LexA family protein [Peptostreptococcus anaerobius]|uniref:LexA family protein n=1 Tax=Peptostreptococcus anaerobius TaxID=1261 RepID=UPI00321B3754